MTREKTASKGNQTGPNVSPRNQFTNLASLSLKSVSLYDWWLVSADGKGLAVGGFASRESLGIRAFSSAAIAKRHDTTTLETVDGITITISGFINRSRTHQNGFPLEVCNHFLLGFPFSWEEYANQYCSQEYVARGVPNNMSSGSCTSTMHLVSLDNIPVTRIHDILISPPRNPDNGAFERRIFSKVISNSSCSITLDETPSNPKKAEADKQCRYHDDILNAREIRTDEFQSSGQSRMGMNILSPSRGLATREAIRSAIRSVNSVHNETPGNATKDKDTRKSKDDDAQLKKHTDFITRSRGVMTRSMARLKTLENKQEENLSSKSSPRQENSAWFLTPEATGIQYGGMLIRSVSKGYPATCSKGNFAVRRSDRLKNTKKSIN